MLDSVPACLAQPKARASIRSSLLLHYNCKARLPLFTASSRWIWLRLSKNWLDSCVRCQIPL